MRRLLTLVGLIALAAPWGPAPAGSTPPSTTVTPSVTAPLMTYLGGMHTHTGYSDGVPGSSPQDAYVRARDVEGLDFTAVTEHSEALDVPLTLSESCLPTEGGTLIECAVADSDPAKALNKWEAQRLMAANTSVPGRFAALRGFEWSSDVHGHVNVYFSRAYTAWTRDGGDASLAGFYKWLQTPAALGGGADGLATFNHPDDKTLCKQLPSQLRPPLGPVCAQDPARNWNDFAFVPELDERIVGIEMYNRSRNYESWVTRALDRGWHLGMVGAEDIHENDWGSGRYAKTGILSTGQTPQAFKESMQQRRTFATLDKSIRIQVQADGHPMGSRLSATSATISATVTGGDVVSLDLLTNGIPAEAGDTPAIAATATGRSLTATVNTSGGERWFMLRATDSTGRRVAYASPIWIGSPQKPAFTSRWVAGDLHVHTTWSHDSYGGLHDDNTTVDEAYVAGWTPGEQIAIAESRGLDFVAITDHNDTRSVYDPGFTSDRLTLIPAYENSLAGHAQMLGVTSCVTPAGPASTTTDCNSFPNRNDPSQIRALRDQVRGLGGAFQVNHPADRKWLDAFGDGSGTDPIVPDSVEVWSIGPWHYQPPAPSSSDNDYSLRFWETYLNAGARVPATGGSDNHWRSTTAVQGVGQPTTWVWVTKPGMQGIIEGIRAGRTSISHLPPAMQGQRLFLGADADGDGNTDAREGGSTPAGSRLQIRATNPPPGAVYRVISNQGSVIVERTGDVTTTPMPVGARWARVELFMPDLQSERTQICDPLVGDVDVDGSTPTYCRNRLIMIALTSPIYVT